MSVPLIVFMLFHAPVFIPGAVPAGIYGNCTIKFSSSLYSCLHSCRVYLLMQWSPLQQKFIMEPLCLMSTGCMGVQNRCLLLPIYSLFWGWEERWGRWRKRIRMRVFLNLLRTVKKKALCRQLCQYPDCASSDVGIHKFHLLNWPIRFMYRKPCRFSLCICWFRTLELIAPGSSRKLH